MKVKGTLKWEKYKQCYIFAKGFVIISNIFKHVSKSEIDRIN